MIVILISFVSIRLIDTNGSEQAKGFYYVLLAALLAIFLSALFFFIPVVSGTDKESYLHIYEAYLNTGIHDPYISSRDIGFRTLLEIGYGGSLNFFQLFFLSQSVCLTMVFLTLKPYRRMLAFYCILYFAFGFLVWQLNGLRQGIAINFVFISIMFLSQRQYIRYIFAILLAATFHSSAVAFLVLYFVPTKRKLLFVLVVAICVSLIVCVILGVNLASLLPTLFSLAEGVNLMGYERYLGSDKLANQEATGTGLVYIYKQLLLIFSSYCILSNKVDNRFILINLSFSLGFSFIGNIVGNVELITRFLLYSEISYLFVVSYAFIYCQKYKPVMYFNGLLLLLLFCIRNPMIIV